MRIVLISFVVFLTGSFASAQQQVEMPNVKYGMNLGQVYTGSGHGAGVIMNSSVRKGRKALEFGMIFKPGENRISGGDVKYKIFLGPGSLDEDDKSNGGVAFKPYFHYNFLYHSAKVDPSAFLPTTSKKSTPSLPSSENTIATMEHFAGMGLQMMLAERFSIDGSLGFGAYLGSLDKFNSPSGIGIHKENHGFVFSFEVGMGYKFGL